MTCNLSDAIQCSAVQQCNAALLCVRNLADTRKCAIATSPMPRVAFRTAFPFCPTPCRMSLLIFTRLNLHLLPFPELPMTLTAIVEAETPDPASTIAFLHLLTNLKNTKRTGWVRCNVPQPESISDHMYRMSIIAMIHPNRSDHLIKLALAHDIAECIVGDITPHDNVTKEEKACMEDEAMRTLQSSLPPSTGQLLYNLWREYEDCVTEDAKIMKEIDKFEMILQADEYETAHNVSLQQFFDSTASSFSSSFMSSLNAQLRLQRAERLLKSSKADR